MENTIQDFPEVQETQKAKKSGKGSKKGLVIALTGIILAVLIASGAFFIAPVINEKNQAAADEVIALIDGLDGKKITLDSEAEVDEASAAYNALSTSQQKLVSNYEILKKAEAALEKAKEKAEQDRIAAEEVIELIDTLKNEEITVDDAAAVKVIQKKYDALTPDQQELVTNYTVLVIAMGKVNDAQDREIALRLVEAIDNLDGDALGTDLTQINALLDRFNGLTDSQKLLVTNYDKLLDCEKTVKKNIEAEKKRQKGIALANNFPGYTGKWGDFGAHKSSYQGMIEKAIKNANVLRKYFECNPNPNYLDMYVSRFTGSPTGYGTASCYVEFSGYAKDSGFYSTLCGEVIIKADGTVYFVVNYFY